MTLLSIDDADEWDFSESDEVTFIYDRPGQDFDNEYDWNENRLKFSIPISTVKKLIYNQGHTQIKVPIEVYNLDVYEGNPVKSTTVLDKNTAESIMDSYYGNYPDKIPFGLNERLKHQLSEQFQRMQELAGIKESTINFDVQETPGNLVVFATLDGRTVGRLRLIPYEDGYQIDSIIVMDDFKGYGIGKNLILLGKDDLRKPIYSDKTHSSEASHLWQSLVKSNQAIKNDDGRYMTT